MWDYPDYPPDEPDGRDGPDEAWFRKGFNLPWDPSSLWKAHITIGADDDFDFYVNNQLVYSDWDGVVWGAPYTISIKPYLVAGDNIFAMYAKDSYGLYEWALVDATIQPIPEPTTVFLMSCGLLGILGIVIRQRRKKKHAR